MLGADEAAPVSPATQQHLVLTPQLRQAIRLLQLSAAELEAEVADAVESNPLLDWQDDGMPADPRRIRRRRRIARTCRRGCRARD